MMRMPLMTALLLAFLIPVAQAAEYRGLCEASAGAFVDDRHFAVASDETNVLQLYERGKPNPVGSADLTRFTSYDKSDLEGAAAIGDRIYWISSHSINRSGRDNKRKIFFATKIGYADGRPTLTGAGKVVETLRKPLAAAAGIADERSINIEALAATPEGGLLIGLRAPLVEGDGKMKAIVITLKNPAAMVDSGAAPEFGEVTILDLGGRGIRSMDAIAGGYIILAGPHVDGPEAFVAYRWGGPGKPLDEVRDLNLAGIKPEGAMAIPGSDMVQLLSDDDNVCSDEGPPQKRRFRSIDIKP